MAVQTAETGFVGGPALGLCPRCGANFSRHYIRLHASGCGNKKNLGSASPSPATQRRRPTTSTLRRPSRVRERGIGKSCIGYQNSLKWFLITSDRFRLEIAFVTSILYQTLLEITTTPHQDGSAISNLSDTIISKFRA